MGLRKRIYKERVKIDQDAVDELNLLLRLAIKAKEKENGTDTRKNNVQDK